MSIIADALKKAQKGQNPHLLTYNKTPRQPVLGPRAGYQAKPKKISGTKKNNFLIGGIVFGTILLLCLAFIFAYMQNSQRVYYVEKPVAAVPAAPAAIPAAINTVQPSEEKDLFQLSGIVHDESKPLAVINDRIVEAGEIVDGAKVTQIDSDSAQLSYRGKKITLYISK